MFIDNGVKPASAADIFRLAYECKEGGRRSEGIGHYRRGLALAPDHVDGLLNLGVLLAEQGQHDEAIRHWQHLLRVRPRSCAVVSQYRRGTGSEGAVGGGGDEPGAGAGVQAGLRRGVLQPGECAVEDG